LKRRKNSVEKTVWSFFSGAMGLDLGLESVGLRPSVAVEKDPTCQETIRKNRPDILIPGTGKHVGDVTKITGASLRKETGVEDEVFLLVGGPPCQSFSTGGNRAALNDPRGNLIYHYLRLVSEIRPRHFVLENVANLVTAALKHRPIKDRPGQHWSLKKYEEGANNTDDGNPPLEPEEMSGSAIRQILADMSGLGYQLRFAVLNAVDFGAAQKRLRFIMIGSHKQLPPLLPEPTHGDHPDLEPHRTLRDAIWDLRADPGPHSVYTEDMAKFFRLVPAGGTWRDLPVELQPEALGGSFNAGGGKTGFFRRLSWDAASPTLTGRANRKGSAICHPDDVRPLSVRECARVQGFPDDWEIAGSMSSQYMQIGNAVPTHLGRAIGETILQSAEERSLPPCVDWDIQLDSAVRTLRAAAANKRKQTNGRGSSPASSSADVSPRQQDLFAYYAHDGSCK